VFSYRLVVLLSFTSVGRVASGQQDSSRAFEISSEASQYVVKGRLTGTFRVQEAHLIVAVKSGSVLVAVADPGLMLRVIIAGPSGTSWRKVVESDPQSLGAFRGGERRDLSDSLVFSLPLPSDLNLQRHWLVFQFGRSDGSTTYACSDRNLAGPDSLSAGRAQQLRMFYPMAC
jgi:hypothetical protein